MIQFADDIAIYTMGLNRQGNKKIIYEALRRIDNNLSDIGLQLKPDKTSIIEFSRSGLVDHNMSIENGKRIKNTDETRFLEIILDNRLKFEKHTSYIKGKMKKTNDVLNYVCGVTRGPEINTALMLYKSVVRSVSDYSGFVYAPVSRQSEIKLERSQFQGLRTALGYRNSTSTNIIIAEAKVIYLRNRAMYLAKTSVLKYLNSDQKIL